MSSTHADLSRFQQFISIKFKWMWILCVVCFDGPLIMVLLVWMYCLLRPSGNFNLDQTNKTVSCRKKSEIFMYIMHCSPNYEHKNSSHNLCKLVAFSVCSFILKTFRWIFTLGSSCSIRKWKHCPSDHWSGFWTWDGEKIFNQN